MSTILCVDDSDSNLFILRAVLSRVGFEVLTATNGEEGVESAKAGQPNLILMDLQMPDLDGYEATKRIKATPEIAHIPVIALSAHEEAEKIALARAAGCAGYACKPLNIPALLQEIRDVLHAKCAPDAVAGAEAPAP